ncbi:MAG: RNA polymerase factor sigma-54 [Terrimicrobiaceae bacterium]
MAVMAGMEQLQGMGMQQTLSPQMQQSLHVLQAPIAELRQLVAGELSENPLLEEVVPESVELSREDPGAGGLQDEWREYHVQRGGGESWTAEALERRQHFFDSQTRPPTLLEHMMSQVDMEGLVGKERAAAEVILGNLDDAGYFRGEIEAAAYPVGLSVAEAEGVLERLQRLDPPGVCARDLAECLLIQLRRDGRGGGVAAAIVKDHLPLLARRKFPELARLLRVPVSEIHRAAEEIRRLDPRPGAAFAPEENAVIAADVVIEKDGEDYVVRVNDDEIPRLRITNTYKDLLSVAGQPREVRDFLREKMRSGKFFMKCLEQRQTTLMAIADQIVRRQRDFLEEGPAYLRPMTMNQVAEAIGVHETTVSRAVSGKYVATPQGIFEFKYFFTSGYTTSGGESLSNESVRKALMELVKSENPAKPLSDQQLVASLLEQGIPIARRTIAKYRDQLGILPSHLRKGVS